MSWNKQLNEPPTDDWGGPWTTRKLEAFGKYVQAYLEIMKGRRWKTIYFDGFAGSGSKPTSTPSELYQQLHLTKEDEQVYKGAAERVLTVRNELTFDYYYFIDKREASLKKLENKLNERLDLSDRKIAYKAGDANRWLQELASLMVSKPEDYAALVFLDPFGMQIDWKSIEALAGTRSDVWILVPTGVIVNRLLDRAGELSYTSKLENFFGLPLADIRQHFYKTEVTQTLFGDEQEIVRKVSKPIGRIAQLYAQRLKSIWNFVTEEPLRLDNRNGVPIFHLVFASNNQTALKIAKQIIKTV